MRTTLRNTTRTTPRRVPAGTLPKAATSLRSTPRRRTYRADTIEQMPTWSEWPAPHIRQANSLSTWLRSHGLNAGMWNRSFQGTDWPLLVIVVALLGLGLLMLYSANIVEWRAMYGLDLDYWFRLQLKWAGVGLVGMVAFWRIRYTFWRNWSVPMLGVTIGALILVMLLGFVRYGMARSLFQGGSVQPSEVAKLVLIIYMADWLASKRDKLGELSFGLVPFMILVGGFNALVVQQKVGTAILLVLVALIMFFVAGADSKQLGIGIVLAAGSFGLVYMFAGHVQERVTAFLSRVINPLEAGVELQIQQFLLSLQQGGVVGDGLGNGRLKDALILSHSDGIFAVIGGELGLLGCLGVIGLFIWLGYRGIRISLQAREPFGLLLGFGITLWLVLQAFIHIGVATATLPVTGMPLPFVSYGGTALVTAMSAVGVLLSISCGSVEHEVEGASGARLDLRRGDGRTYLPGLGGH